MLEIITQTKLCSTCKTEKIFTMFSASKNKKFGIQSKCKMCVATYQALRKDEIDEQKRKWYITNKKQIIQKRKDYYKTNKDDILDKQRKNYNDNKIKILDQQQQYYIINKNKISEQHKKYYKTSKGKFIAKNSRHKRRSKTKQGDATYLQISELQQNAKFCYWCNTSLKNKKVHIDHYVALSKGGEHTLSNLVVSCQKCNNQKHAKDPIEFANSIGKLL